VSLKEKSIIVIEDDKDIRDLIAFNIKNAGFHSIEAKNGEKGIEKVRKKTPDLILLDLMLPGIQGLDVCRIIKSDKDTKNIPIIMVSALGQEEDIITGLETGADDYITKPFSIKILLARIEAVLRRRLDQVEHDDEKALNISGIIIEPRRREVKVVKQLRVLLSLSFKFYFFCVRIQDGSLHAIKLLIK